MHLKNGKLKYGVSDYENQLLLRSPRTFWLLSLWFHLSCLFPLPAQPPALHPGCLTHVISPPAVPLALERHKRLLWRYQQQPLWLTSTSPFPGTAHKMTVSTSSAPWTLNYCQQVISPTPPHIRSACVYQYVYAYWKQAGFHCICSHLKISTTTSFLQYT